MTGKGIDSRQVAFKYQLLRAMMLSAFEIAQIDWDDKDRSPHCSADHMVKTHGEVFGYWFH